MNTNVNNNANTADIRSNSLSLLSDAVDARQQQQQQQQQLRVGGSLQQTQHLDGRPESQSRSSNQLSDISHHQFPQQQHPEPALSLLAVRQHHQFPQQQQQLQQCMQLEAEAAAAGFSNKDNHHVNVNNAMLLQRLQAQWQQQEQVFIQLLAFEQQRVCECIYIIILYEYDTIFF